MKRKTNTENEQEDKKKIQKLKKIERQIQKRKKYRKTDTVTEEGTQKVRCRK